jgi:hypothetical protein
MKKILILILITFVSCTPNIETTAPIDCDCDRVVSVYTFNVIGTPQNPDMVYFSNYTTINDCTQIQKEKTLNTTVQNQVPVLGQCR